MIEPVKVTDVTLRDGLEDFVLKQLRLEDLARLGSLLDRAGFYSIDCCGGATFYTALAELKEDPWERLKRMRRALTGTPIQMILRGRMLVGFKPYDDEVVRRFMVRATHLGVDIFRIYDTLNDLDNMEMAIRTGKELRKQVEATILYSLNPHVTLEDYLNLISGLVNLGADVICINDSFGAMNPTQVGSLVSACRRYFHQPLRLHLHDNHQAAISSYQEGIRQGVALVDTTLAAMFWAYGPPPVESLMFSLGGSPHDPHLDLDLLGEVTEYLESLKEKYRYRQPPPRKLDDRLGPSYVPGPLKEFIREELKRRDARDRQQVAFKEAQEVWSDLGYPALKGRILEIVGLQAVENIQSPRRYDHLIPSMEDLLRGKYGRLHSPVKLELQWLALGLEEAGEAAPLPPEPLRSRAGLEGEEDILTYSLFPEEAEALFYFRTQAPPPAPATPEPPATRPNPHQPPQAHTELILNHKGEEVRARLEGVGALRQDKQVLFINIGDHIEEMEIQLLPGEEDRPDFLVTFHGDTYRIRINQPLSREQEYNPVSLEINGQLEEFLLKKTPGEG
jgi:pyruvate/oxaloacetate carboxyltransferase